MLRPNKRTNNYIRIMLLTTVVAFLVSGCALCAAPGQGKNGICSTRSQHASDLLPAEHTRSEGRVPGGFVFRQAALTEQVDETVIKREQTKGRSLSSWRPGGVGSEEALWQDRRDSEVRYRLKEGLMSDEGTSFRSGQLEGPLENFVREVKELLPLEEKTSAEKEALGAEYGALRSDATDFSSLVDEELKDAETKEVGRYGEESSKEDEPVPTGLIVLAIVVLGVALYSVLWIGLECEYRRVDGD